MKKMISFLSLFFMLIGTTSAHPGIGIVIDNHGNIFYTDLTHVWKISPEGFLDDTTLIRDPEGNSYWSKKSGNGEILMKQTLNGTNNQLTEHLLKGLNRFKVQ